jgi:ergothioneine biosynthesis protein EgtB
MADASPAKWHLAHTTWFFETFVLEQQDRNYTPFDPDYRFLFNSYYNAVGAQYARPHRGLLTRPSLATIHDYRETVNERMSRLIDSGVDSVLGEVIEVGLQHEQQHQELLLMDVKHLFSRNPTAPAYATAPADPDRGSRAQTFYEFAGGVVSLGAGMAGFSFDNERPRHDTLLPDYALASRPVTNREYLDFVRDGGYDTPLLWLSDGWATIKGRSWRAPLYWREVDGEWFEFSLHGLHKLSLDAPVVHVSYYEADAYARWADARLATEAEWETAAMQVTVEGNFVESGHLEPRPAEPVAASLPSQMFGDVWEWTMSPYTPYPGFETPAGAIGEYNGKFMSGQMVLRGGGCVTPREHIRGTYRNFFYPGNRWQFGGIRLAR